MRSAPVLVFLAFAGLFACALEAAAPRYQLDDLVSLAQAQNPEIAIARKKVEAARGGQLEARAGYLPSVVSSGLYRRRERAESSRLRPDDYNASIRVIQNLYTGGATSARDAIARLTIVKEQDEFQAVTDRVIMDVRLAYYELLLHREEILVRQEAVAVLRQELKSQRERLSAGTVGPLDTSRAEVAVANEEPELVQAQTDLQNSQLRLSELCGLDAAAPQFEAVGTLQYEPRRPGLEEALARAVLDRPEIRSAEKDMAIEERQWELDRSASRPHVELFGGYEAYSERDPNVGPEFNHGYVVGLNASWPIFDGFATRGRMQATRARRDGAQLALKAVKLGIQSEVRSAFLDLQQADSVLQAQAKNVRTADEALTYTKSNLAAGLGTQLDVLQAASDLTHSRSTRLSAIYLHNTALARLDRAMGRAYAESAPAASANGQQIFEVVRPPATLKGRK